MNKGVLTMAYGPSRYVRMARGLARSIRLRNPHVPIAIVTDRRASELQPLFDDIIPLDRAFGAGLAQKLHLDRYTPFQQTLYIDSDFLLFRNLDEIWAKFATAEALGLIGYPLTASDTHYAISDLREYLKKLGLQRMFMTNTGILWFDRSPRALAAFDAVRSLASQAGGLGVEHHPAGFFNDEPLFGTVVEMLGLPVVPADESRTFTLGSFGTGTMSGIDVRTGRSRYTLNGVDHEPAAIHFNVHSQQSYVYDRELRRLEHRSGPWADRLTRLIWLPRELAYRYRQAGGGLNGLATVGRLLVRGVLRSGLAPFKRAYRFAQRRWQGTVPGLEQNPLQAAIGHFFEGRDAVFVQVGANDGVQLDPLREHILRNPRWSGLFIEPLLPVFKRLRENYGGAHRFRFENVAIGSERGRREFFYVAEAARAQLGAALPFWYDQLGSFNRDHIARHLEGKLAPFVASMQVECVPLREVLERNGLRRVDLLQIDTEGFDYHVLRQLDFRRYAPSVILYEHKWMSPDDLTDARELLQRNGYRLIAFGDETLALRIGWRARLHALRNLLGTGASAARTTALSA